MGADGQSQPTDTPDRGRAELKSGAAIGLVSGFAAITCCVSPVVFVLIGIATAAEAVTLGDTLYYDYGWFFRAFGAVVAAAAVIVYLRRTPQLQHRRRTPALAHARLARARRRRNLRRAVLVHQVPRHLVRLDVGPSDGAPLPSRPIGGCDIIPQLIGCI